MNNTNAISRKNALYMIATRGDRTRDGVKKECIFCKRFEPTQILFMENNRYLLRKRSSSSGNYYKY